MERSSGLLQPLDTSQTSKESLGMWIFPPCSMREHFICKQFSPGEETFPILKRTKNWAFPSIIKKIPAEGLFLLCAKTEMMSSLTVSFECCASLFYCELTHCPIPWENLFHCLLQEMPLVSWEGCLTDFYPDLTDQEHIFLKLFYQISESSELLCSQLGVTVRNRAG